MRKGRSAGCEKGGSKARREGAEDESVECERQGKLEKCGAKLNSLCMRHGLCVLGRKRRARVMNAGFEGPFWRDMPRKGHFVGALRAFGAARSLFFSGGLGCLSCVVL